MNGTANPWSRGAMDSCPYSMACACSGPLQGCVQKQLVLGRDGSMTGTVTLPGQGAYKREQQHVSAE